MDNLDFTQYLDEETKESSGEYRMLSDYQINEFCERLSGRTEDGKNKAKLSYTNYMVKEGNFENLPVHSILDIHNARIEIFPNRTLPDFYTIDIIFPDAECRDLKILWMKLEQFKKADRNSDFDNQAVILIQASENFELKDLKDVKNRLFCNILNPLLFYLTRETPNQKTNDVKTEEGLQGGNIIRLLCHTSLVTFDFLDNVDIEALREEIEYEAQTEAQAEIIKEEEYKRLLEITKENETPLSESESNTDNTVIDILNK